jgi:hypothetical protein
MIVPKNLPAGLLGDAADRREKLAGFSAGSEFRHDGPVYFRG